MLKYTRIFSLIIVDCIIVVFSLFMSAYLIFRGSIPVHYMNIFIHSSIMLVFINIGIYYICGLYKSLWQYASDSELLQVFFATMFGSLASIVFGNILNMSYPRQTYMIYWLITLFLIGGVRLSYRVLRRLRNLLRSASGKEASKKVRDKTRIMIIGAGDAGSMVIKELRYHHKDMKYEPVAVIDDNKIKHKTNINGVPVVGGRDMIKVAAEKYKVDEIIIALPSVSKSEISAILRICMETKCKLITLPGVYEIINGRVSVKSIRDVNIEDLLGRDQVRLNIKEISGYLRNETVLVTGGGGSIGSELCRQIAKFGPKKLVILDIYENNAYDLQNELRYIYKDKLNLEVVIGSVRDTNRLKQVFSQYKPGIVFHAAAHKHVPLMEANPAEAVKNNVFGTLNTAMCANEFHARKFVLISTDKAVNPTNIMGATKRMAEMIIQSLDKISDTEFAAVRFGNVLGSNGSVIPLFKKQIAHGGPVTVTHPDIIRYFMTIPEAAQLVIQAGIMAKGGEIFILDMGEPVRIADLAKDLIKLSGLKPDIDIRIEYTGLRPGEKLYEELLLEEEGIRKTAHEKIYVAKPLDMDFNNLMKSIRKLERNISDEEVIKECLESTIGTYVSSYDEVAAARQ